MRSILLLLVSLGLPAEAAAQATLSPYTATYATTAQYDGRAMDIGARRITVSDTMIGGRHGWVVEQVTEISHDPLRDPTDSLVMTADLRPLSRRTKLGSDRIVMDVADGRVTGWQTVRGGGQRPISLPLAEGGFLNVWGAFVAIPGLPLAPAWLGSLHTVALGGNPEWMEDDLFVEDRERVTVPAGTFDCLVVGVREHGQLVQRLWVSTERHVVVRSLEGSGDGSIVTMELSTLDAR